MPSEFQEKVYGEVKKIKKGEVKTYGEIAKRLKTSPRAVGQALRKNPFPIKIPCHRVIRSDGMVGGYAGVWNSKKKIQLLKSEGVKIKAGKVVN